MGIIGNTPRVRSVNVDPRGVCGLIARGVGPLRSVGTTKGNQYLSEKDKYRLLTDRSRVGMTNISRMRSETRDLFVERQYSP